MPKAVLTGHRPEKLPRSADDYFDVMQAAYVTHGIDTVINGLQSGIDIIGALAGIDFGLRTISVSPGIWHKVRGDWQEDYNLVVNHSNEIVYADKLVHRGYPGAWAYEVRNRCMVDMLDPSKDIVIAVWDGSESGTKNCVSYAREKNIRVFKIDPKTLIGEWYYATA